MRIWAGWAGRVGAEGPEGAEAAGPGRLGGGERDAQGDERGGLERDASVDDRVPAGLELAGVVGHPVGEGGGGQRGVHRLGDLGVDDDEGDYGERGERPGGGGDPAAA